MTQIKVENITLAYQNSKVINNLSFSVNEGDFLCILGENGSGKSTLIKSILGLKELNSGKITFSGGLKQDQIGYLPQQDMTSSSFPATVLEVVSSGVLNGNKFFINKDDKKLIQNNLKILGINDLKDKCFYQLSGGQKQKTLLARALCATKKLLLLDEPTSSLDPFAAREFFELISKINKEYLVTIIVVSHDMNCANYASHILHLGTKNIFTTRERYMNGGNFNV